MKLKTERAIPVQRAAYFSCRAVRLTGTLMPALSIHLGNCWSGPCGFLPRCLFLNDSDGPAGPVGSAAPAVETGGEAGQHLGHVAH